VVTHPPDPLPLIREGGQVREGVRLINNLWWEKHSIVSGK